MEPREFGEWIETIGGHYGEPVLLRAREEYQTLTGQIFQDDKSYESRMGLFFEWFTVDRKLPESGKTPLEEFLDDPQNTQDGANPGFAEIMTQTLHGIYQVTQAKPGGLRVREMFGDKEYRVMDPEGGMYFNRHDVFEGRLIRLQDSGFLSANFLYHPPQAVKFIKSKVKAIQAQEKEAEKEFRKMEKEQAVIQKKQAVHEKELARLVAKIEKTKKPEKRETLEQEKRDLEEEGRVLARGKYETAQRVANYKSMQLGQLLHERRFELIQKLSYMSLKWERSRQIALTDIYKD
ncbi:MAG: hypothetical protein KC553_10535 [Nitrospina sp.]|nr:hypothetical protein [Nitrospina sp.]